MKYSIILNANFCGQAKVEIEADSMGAASRKAISQIREGEIIPDWHNVGVDDDSIKEIAIKEIK